MPIILPGSNQLLLQSVLGPPPHLLAPELLQALAQNELLRISTAMLNLRVVKAKAREPSSAKREQIKQDSRLQALLALVPGLTMNELLKMKEGT